MNTIEYGFSTFLSTVSTNSVPVVGLNTISDFGPIPSRDWQHARVEIINWEQEAPVSGGVYLLSVAKVLDAALFELVQSPLDNVDV